MRLTTVRTPTGTRAGRLVGETIELLDAPDVDSLLAHEDNLAHAAAAPVRSTIALSEANLAPPVIAPGKIICLGLNYRAHIAEMGREMPTHPTLFAKYREAIIGPHDDICLPRGSTMVDWEGELAFVIGRTVRGARGDEALAAIAGYTICNDISARDFQRRTLQWLQGKTFEGSTPIGPAIVTPDELRRDDRTVDLLMTCTVDGELMQSARTSDLVFPPRDIVEYVSDIITLRPGDVISTGTCGGVGEARDPQRFLQPGSVVRTSIEGIGELVNICRTDVSR